MRPETAAHQAPPFLGFSRQQHWSGLPFPSPMHESEKWKGSRSVVSDTYRPHGLQPTRLLHPWDFPGKSTGLGCHCCSPSLSLCQDHTISITVALVYILKSGTGRPPTLFFSLEVVLAIHSLSIFHTSFRILKNLVLQKDAIDLIDRVPDELWNEVCDIV